MPSVWVKAKFKGEKGEEEALSRLNTGADYVVVPAEFVKKLGLKSSRREKLYLADGRIIEKEVFEIGIEITDDRGKARKCKVNAIASKRAYPLISVEAMKKLRMIQDVMRGKRREAAESIPPPRFEKRGFLAASFIKGQIRSGKSQE